MARAWARRRSSSSTKSGTNDFHGGYFHTFRHDSLNTNNWFNTRDNLPKPDLLQNQPGFNIGGPILLPGFNGRNRAFFFVNYEESIQNNTIRRDRTILFPTAQNGRLPIQRRRRRPRSEHLRHRRGERTDVHRRIRSSPGC